MEVGDPCSYREAIEVDDSDRWITAIDQEMESLKRNHTCDLVTLPRGSRAIGCKWIFRKKDCEQYKVRLVAKWYAQREGIVYNEIFSPVVKHTSIRFLLAIVSLYDLELEHMNVKITFLHGELEEEIYMKQPEGFIREGDEGKVCLLKKSLYGLKQSPRQWYKRFDSFMIKANFTRCEYDSCVYYKLAKGPTYLLLYVDDTLIAAKDKAHIGEIKSQLKLEFDMKDLG